MVVRPYVTGLPYRIRPFTEGLTAALAQADARAVTAGEILGAWQAGTVG
jgi:hypothetical protein